MKSLEHKRDAKGEVVLEYMDEGAFDYIGENNLLNEQSNANP